MPKRQNASGRSSYKHLRFTAKVPTNPRRPNTHGGRVFELILRNPGFGYYDLKHKAIAVEQALGIPQGRMSGLSNHLAWDLNRGHIEGEG